MTSRKLIKYGLALERITEKAMPKMRERGFDGLDYNGDLAISCESSAFERSNVNFTGYGGMNIAAAIAMVGAVGGAALSATLVANGEQGLAALLYKTGAAIVGAGAGGVLAGAVPFTKWYINEKIIGKVREKRKAKKTKREKKQN